MILLALLFAAAVLIIGCWGLIEIHRSRRSATALLVAIPILLGLPFGFYAYGNTLMGYAVEENMGEFELVHALMDEKRRAIYALVRPQGNDEPRLYKITKDYEKNKQKFGKAQKQAQAGVQVQGRQAKKQANPDGNNTEEEFVFYILPPAESMRK